MNTQAAVQIYPLMDSQLKQAFYTCYQNYGKISTKKLIACFVEPTAVSVADQIIARTGYKPVPSRTTVKQYKETANDDIACLVNLAVGPGVSPCVMRTCHRLLQEQHSAGKEGMTIDTLHFLQVLCATAVELSRLVRQHQIDVPQMIANARKQCS